MRQHVVLLGDSILDNGVYTPEGCAVINYLQNNIQNNTQSGLTGNCKASLLAVDGAITDDVFEQLTHIPQDATALILSIGGNNALSNAHILGVAVKSVGEGLRLLYDVINAFEISYRKLVSACLQHQLPLNVCTIYHGDFPDPDYKKVVMMALTLFNDVILRVAEEHQLRVIDLRLVCNVPADFVGSIEPSAQGGEKIASAIMKQIMTSE